MKNHCHIQLKSFNLFFYEPCIQNHNNEKMHFLFRILKYLEWGLQKVIFDFNYALFIASTWKKNGQLGKYVSTTA